MERENIGPFILRAWYSHFNKINSGEAKLVVGAQPFPISEMTRLYKCFPRVNK
jgi:hypothetical protein